MLENAKENTEAFTYIPLSPGIQTFAFLWTQVLNAHFLLSLSPAAQHPELQTTANPAFQS